mmetsp:Transcript_20354/g.66629  ORF Transcript_20354/g.66629 Transcript_20354/m.66629 type:complete len:253 (+) Transcript_20354:69-827(+)
MHIEITEIGRTGNAGAGRRSSGLCRRLSFSSTQPASLRGPPSPQKQPSHYGRPERGSLPLTITSRTAAAGQPAWTGDRTRLRLCRRARLLRPATPRTRRGGRSARAARRVARCTRGSRPARREAARRAARPPAWRRARQRRGRARRGAPRRRTTGARRPSTLARASRGGWSARPARASSRARGASTRCTDACARRQTGLRRACAARWPGSPSDATHAAPPPRPIRPPRRRSTPTPTLHRSRGAPRPALGDLG